MASKNQLLSKGALIEAAMKTQVVKAVTKVQVVLDPPILMHHAVKPSKVAKTQEELERLIDDGFADHPGKVKRLPGWEHLFAGEEIEEKIEEKSIFDPQT